MIAGPSISNSLRLVFQSRKVTTSPMHLIRHWSALRGIAAVSLPILLVAVSACSHKGDSATPTTVSAATRVFDVTARPVESSQSAVSLSASGNLAEEQNSPVTIVSGGRVLAAPATVGAYVEKGAVLL